MKIMRFDERFSWYNNKELSNIDKSFSDILKIERDWLLKIFKCRDLINYQIGCLSVKEKVAESQQKLLDNLIDSKRDLFKKFFINYCKSKNLLKFSDNFSDQLEKYDEIDDTVRYSLWVRIFDDVDKDNILNLFDKPLEYDDIYVFVDDFVSNFVDSISDYLSTFLPEWSSEQFINDFVIYFKNIVSKIVSEKLKISKKNNLDLNDLFSLISDVIFDYVDKNTVNEIYYEFLVSKTYSEYLEKDYNVSWNDSVNDDYNDYEVVVPCVWQLLKCTGIKDSDILNKLDGYDLDRRKSEEDDISNFIQNVLDVWNEFWGLNRDEFNEKIYSLHFDEHQYEIWKEMFLKRIKFPVKTWDLKLSGIEDSSDVMNYISEMRIKYPRAKNYIWKIWSHNFKEMKADFLRIYFDDLLNKLSIVLNDESFKKSSLIQLFKIMYIYIWILKWSKFNLDADFQEYIKKHLEKSFRESHQSVKDKEGGNKNPVPIVESVEEPENVVLEEKTVEEPIQKKEWLPQEVMDDINFYFENVDSNFTDDQKRAIIKIVEGFPLVKASDKDKKYYKKSWFKDFNLNDIFFQNLDKNWYFCEPDDIKDVVVPNESIQSPVVSVDPLSLKTQEFLSKISKCDNTKWKVDVCIDVLKFLWYTFYANEQDSREKYEDSREKNEWKISGDILNFCKSNCSTFINTMVKLINWNQVLEKKKKKRENMPVYWLAIWDTWYRLVCLDKWNNEKKAIYALMNHNDYTTFLDKKCSG